MKIQIRALPYIYPVPIVLVGANVNEVPNFETIGDVGLMGIKPPIVYVSSGGNHFTNQGILENHTFSINFPNTEMLAVVDYCGQVSGKDVNKGALFDIFYGELNNAPMIQACPVCLECRVIKTFSIQHRQVFVGEVASTHIEKDFVSEQDGHQVIADLTRLDPILYALDNHYYCIGEPIGIGYQEAKKLAKP